VAKKVKEFSQSYFHGTKADLRLGEQIVSNFHSNYVKGMQSKYVYLTSNLNAAAWGAELASGDGPGRIYVVEPSGPIEDDPNLTDKKFPGNPTNSFRTRDPLVVLAEVIHWQGHPLEDIMQRKEKLEGLSQSGEAKIIED
jgi:hypothetical protein